MAGLKGSVHDCPLPFLLLNGPQATFTFWGPDPLLLSPLPASSHHLHDQNLHSPRVSSVPATLLLGASALAQW